MIVSYPMYALPEMHNSLSSWWSAVYKGLEQPGIEVPTSISPIDHDLISHWLNPDLLLSQTCGFPLVSQLKSQVKLVGTPVYSASGCEGPNYCSFYIVQENDSRIELKDYQGARFTYNGTDSQSGFNAVRMNLDDCGLVIPFFDENILSGGHRESILNVGKGAAEICAVDCVTHALLDIHQPEVLQNTRILAQTRGTPGLPFITSIDTDDEIVEALFNAINHVANDDSMKDINRKLQLNGVNKIDIETYYQAISLPDKPIEKL